MTWPRDLFAEAVWSSRLKPLERLVALAYASHARDQEFAFLTYPRMQEVTGLSRDAIARAVTGLRDAGWLELMAEARQHHAARYWLRIPIQQSVSRTAEPTRDTGDGLLSDTSSPSPDTSSPSPGPDHSEDNYAYLSARETDPWDSDANDPPALSDDDRAAAETRARDTGLRIDVVTAAVVQLRATKDIGSMTAYLRSIDKAGIERLAGLERSTPKVAAVEDTGRTCGLSWHVKGGMRIHGTGVDASRVCPGCEARFPAAQAAAEVQPPAPRAAEAAS